jgi:hypothetical protein
VCTGACLKALTQKSLKALLVCNLDVELLDICTPLSGIHTFHVHITARCHVPVDLDLADRERQVRYRLDAGHEAGNALQGPVDDAGMKNELVKIGTERLGNFQLAHS